MENDVAASLNGTSLREANLRRLADALGPENPFAIGTSLLATPLVGAVYATAHEPILLDRMHYAPRLAFTLTTWLAVLGGLLLLHRVLSDRVGSWPSLVLLLLSLFATPLGYYSTLGAGMSHGISFAASAVLVYATDRWRRSLALSDAIFVGLALGIASIIRWPSVLLGLYPIAVLLSAGSVPIHRRIWCGVAAAGAALIAVLPQLVYWQVVFGGPFQVPQGAGFFNFDPQRLWLLLASPINGALYTHPILLLFALVGCWSLRRREWPLIGAALAVIGGVIVNASAGDWWAGGSFGQRRMMDLLPFLLVLVATSRRSRSFWAVLGGFGFVLAVLNELVVAQLAHRWILPYPWGFRLADLPLQLRALGREPGAMLFTSDLFIAPAGGYHAPPMQLAFGLAIASIEGVGCLLLTGASRWLRRPALAIAIAALLLYTHTTARMEWRRDPELPRLLELRDQLAAHRLDEAEPLSRQLSARFPRAVADFWLAYAPMAQPRREEQLAPFAARFHASENASTHRTYETLYLGRDATRWAQQRRQSPIANAWLEVDRALVTAQPPQDVEELLRRVERLDPLSIRIPYERLRMETDPRRRQRLMDRLTDRGARSRWLAAAVQRELPGHEDAFLHLWRDDLGLEIEAAAFVGNELLLGNRWRLASEAHLPIANALHWRGRWLDVEYLNALLADHDSPRFIPPTREGPHPGVLPAQLWESDGWGTLEGGDKRPQGYRWSQAPLVFMHLQTPLDPGTWSFHLRGYSWPEEAFRRDLRIGILGSDSRASFPLPGGAFELHATLAVTRRIERPLLWIHVPVHAVGEQDPRATDNRHLGFLYDDLWYHLQPTDAAP